MSFRFTSSFKIAGKTTYISRIITLHNIHKMGATMGKTGGNFLDALPTQGTLHVVMLGLDSAGKTTALYRLKFDQYLNTVPTIGFNCEKVQGNIGKAKGVQFLVWDVGGQEKLRPLWRSYTRCTDGILFVVDSVDVERMEEAKMELMRTAKCPDNQGVPVLILANKQDLPGAREPKELEKLLSLHELSPLYPSLNLTSMSSSSSSTGNIVGASIVSESNSTHHTQCRSLTPTAQHNKPFIYIDSNNSGKDHQHIMQYNTFSSSETTLSTAAATEYQEGHSQLNLYQKKTQMQVEQLAAVSISSPSSAVTTPTTANGGGQILTTSRKAINVAAVPPSRAQNLRGWYIQPACAITGDGLQEGLEALYEMILRRRKITKAHKKKR